MATKKDIKSFLKQVNLTEADIDRMWNEAAEKNTLVANLIKQNVDWRNMNMSVINSIPQEKENQIKRAEEARMKQEKEQKKRDAEAELERARLNSLNNEDLLIERCLKKDLTEEELREIVFEDSIANVIETLEGDDRRWVRSMETIIQLKDRYFSICWDKGLTENQDHSFYNQPVEVIQEKKVICKTVIEWKVKQNEN